MPSSRVTRCYFVQTPEPKLAEEAIGKLPPYSSALTMKPASTSSVAEVT